jgi:hypothetical protein
MGSHPKAKNGRVSKKDGSLAKRTAGEAPGIPKTTSGGTQKRQQLIAYCVLIRSKNLSKWGRFFYVPKGKSPTFWMRPPLPGKIPHFLPKTWFRMIAKGDFLLKITDFGLF